MNRRVRFYVFHLLPVEVSYVLDQDMAGTNRLSIPIHSRQFHRFHKGLLWQDGVPMGVRCVVRICEVSVDSGSSGTKVFPQG